MSEKKKPTLPQLPQTETQRGGLGRGLAALIPTSPSKPRLGAGAADVILGPAGQQRHSDDTPEESTKGADAVPEVEESIGATYQELPLGAIRRNRKNPRETFEEEPLNELVHSIKEFGLLQPVVVRPAGKGTYELIMGERRLRASKLAGLATIPAIVRETDDQDMLRDALLENIHRVQLNPLEEASAYQQLLEEFDVTQAELARRLGRSRPLITNMIRLLHLPVGAQRKVAAGVLSAGHARALLGVKAGADVQEKLAERIIAEGLSVRATEEAVVLLNRGDEQEPRKAPAQREQPESVTRWASSAADALDTRVTVQMGAKKGKIVVEFGDEDDFERITDLLKLSRE
jgi:ParB family chromosome partitioning protein